jgi:hypothetical protein
VGITSALFAQGGGQAGGHACGFRPFVFRDWLRGPLFDRFPFRRGLDALGIRLGFVLAFGRLVRDRLTVRDFGCFGCFGLAFLGADRFFGAESCLLGGYLGRR